MANLGKIRDIAKRKGITLGMLANMVDISEQGIYKMMRNNSTSIDTLEKIAKALDCSILEFIDENPSVSISGNVGSNITTAGRDINNSDGTIKQALNEIAEQRKLTTEAQRQSAELINIVKNLTNK